MIQLSIRRVLFLVAALATVGCAAQQHQNKDAGGTNGDLMWSSYRGSFTKFIQQAIREKKVAFVDKDVTPPEPLLIDGDLVLKGKNVTIFNKHKQLFVIGPGEHHFSHFRVQQSHPEGCAFSSVLTPKLVWNNTLDDVHITGGQYGYNSSRGGLYDEKQDSILAWSGTTILNSTFNVRYIAIAVFAQDGAAKFLHMRNVQLSTAESHNLYIHPNVSMRLDSVASIKAGKLAMHHFSGGNEQFYYKARYLEMNRISSPGKAPWEMVSPKTGYVRISNSHIAPYTTGGVRKPKVYAVHTTFYNSGNGIMLTGIVDSCSGGIWSGADDELLIKNSKLTELTMRPGGKVTVENSQIDFIYLSDRGADYDVELRQCTVGTIVDGNSGKGQVKLKNTQLKNKRPIRPGILVQQ